MTTEALAADSENSFQKSKKSPNFKDRISGFEGLFKTTKRIEMNNKLFRNRVNQIIKDFSLYNYCIIQHLSFFVCLVSKILNESYLTKLLNCISLFNNFHKIF